MKKTLTIATWNVNSINVRMPHILKWCHTHKPDILALQETKTMDENFPSAPILEAGYKVIFSGQQKYNGMAILSREKALEVETTFPSLADPQKRILVATIHGIRVVNLYVPNGESLESAKYPYKLEWLQHCKDYLKKSLKRFPNMVVLGDFNIAPDDRDVYNPKIWRDRVLVSPPERAAFQSLLDANFHDALRLFHEEGDIFSWWDYRAGSRYKSRGLRIDHILVSDALKPNCIACEADPEPRGWERPSDHGVVFAKFAL